MFRKGSQITDWRTISLFIIAVKERGRPRLYKGLLFFLLFGLCPMIMVHFAPNVNTHLNGIALMEYIRKYFQDGGKLVCYLADPSIKYKANFKCWDWFSSYIGDDFSVYR